mmetsp:Transcript_11717/g.13471  ORF Transcript_11717/g.13471 Transcript_11717/m.13471 type:complete len:101 (-) Transcript_11717:346-648(-)|eukprot:CAMPEP_0184018696 /NCGR_PEP_ID=MMETSP0954-20121128/8296_1 /TAXON_ID=627963 /ORGANISM="Aplanochytrium sp, Strain PBS07" /LENGTH=100 /DNA_ID=CAMNT_0026300193 /DNA_START=242 /DNA_END=544 /DNA_ORIENTATION=-
MARKGGPSQVGQNSGAPPAGAGSAPSGPMTGMRRRRNVARSGVNASQVHASRQGPSTRDTLRFYTDDAPGLKVGPTTVLVLSVMFIGCVVMLHIWGKFTS